MGSFQTMEPIDEEPPRIYHLDDDLFNILKQTKVQEVHTKPTSIELLSDTDQLSKLSLVDQNSLNQHWLQQVKNSLSNSKNNYNEDGDVGLQIEGEIFDYSEEKHKPSSNYAVPVEWDFDLRFELTALTIQVFKNLPPLHLPEHPLHSKLPTFSEPYFIFSKQVIYIGQWKFGIPAGIGIMYYQISRVDEGEFDGAELNGKGRSVLQDGTLIEGDFLNGQLDGSGQILKKNQFFFRGRWLNGKPDGEGEEHWPDQSTYRGNFKNGCKHGYGEQEWYDQFGVKKETYKGEFKNGKYDGKGIYEWQNGRTYEGGWLMGKMHGRGVFLWKDGRKYEGEYFNDLKHGEGIFTWPEVFDVKSELQEDYILPLKQWKGTWKNGAMHGKGDLLFKGKHYKGIWDNGKVVKQAICDFQFKQLCRSNSGSDALRFLAIHGQIIRQCQKRKTGASMNNSKTLKAPK